MGKEIRNIEKLMENKGVEFRDFGITKIETRSSEDGAEHLILQGMPAVFEEETELFRFKNERFIEVIDRDAFGNCDMSDVIFNYNHHGRVYARTRNKSLLLNLTETGLLMRAELWDDDPGHLELYRDIARGNIDRMSFAFSVKTSDFSEETIDGIIYNKRRIMEIDKLYDVSAVDIPAYDSTSISARRAFDAARCQREAESMEAESLDRARKAEEIRRKLLIKKIRERRNSGY